MTDTKNATGGGVAAPASTSGVRPTPTPTGDPMTHSSPVNASAELNLVLDGRWTEIKENK